QAKQYAESAKHHERPAPTVILADEAAEESARDGPDINGGLMRSHGARARSPAVIVADERHRSGEVESFAQSLRGAEKQKWPQVEAGRREHTNDAPRLKPPQNGRLAADTIDNVACEGSTDSVDQGERRAQQTELHFVEMQRALKKRKNREDRLPVRVIEKAAE